jgi:hypothetical protein
MANNTYRQRTCEIELGIFFSYLNSSYKITKALNFPSQAQPHTFRESLLPQNPRNQDTMGDSQASASFLSWTKTFTN